MERIAGIDLSRFANDIENMEILAEECAEVSQIKSKIMRFGIDDFYPDRGITNRAALEQELGHVYAMVEILIDRKIITRQGVEEGMRHKLLKLHKWYDGNRGDTNAYTNAS